MIYPKHHDGPSRNARCNRGDDSYNKKSGNSYTVNPSAMSYRELILSKSWLIVIGHMIPEASQHTQPRKKHDEEDAETESRLSRLSFFCPFARVRLAR